MFMAQFKFRCFPLATSQSTAGYVLVCTRDKEMAKLVVQTGADSSPVTPLSHRQCLLQPNNDAFWVPSMFQGLWLIGVFVCSTRTTANIHPFGSGANKYAYRTTQIWTLCYPKDSNAKAQHSNRDQTTGPGLYQVVVGYLLHGQVLLPSLVCVPNEF